MAKCVQQWNKCIVRFCHASYAEKGLFQDTATMGQDTVDHIRADCRCVCSRRNVPSIPRLSVLVAAPNDTAAPTSSTECATFGYGYVSAITARDVLF